MGHTDPEKLKGHSFRQIKALPGTPTKRMDSIKVDAVVEPERRGKRDHFSSMRQLSLMKQNLWKETRMMFPLDFRMLLHWE